MTRADDAARAPGHERDHQLAGMADDSLVANAITPRWLVREAMRSSDLGVPSGTLTT